MIHQAPVVKPPFGCQGGPLCRPGTCLMSCGMVDDLCTGVRSVLCDGFWAGLVGSPSAYAPRSTVVPIWYVLSRQQGWWLTVHTAGRSLQSLRLCACPCATLCAVVRGCRPQRLMCRLR